MIHFLRLVAATVTTGIVIFTPAAFAASGVKGQQHMAILSPAPPGSSQGYLGINMRDVDGERASALKLKEPVGAEVIYVDHDAPAGTAGLKVHDVILQMDGQPIQGVEPLSRMLRETPAGRSVTFLISRDGQQQTITTQLADRAALEQNAWSQRTIIPDPDDEDSTYTFTPTAPASHGFASGFLGALTFSGPSIGVQLDVLGSQLADYFGVKDGQGLLVKHVAANSPASNAGLKAGDVVTKVNGQVMASVNNWAKAIRTNRGKQVQVTIFRNRREQTLSLQAGEAKHKGDLEYPAFPEGSGFFFDDNAKAQLNAELAQLKTQPPIDLQQLRDTIDQSMASIDTEKLMDEARQSLQSIDTEKLRQQMEEQSKQMQKQMQELQKDFQTFRIEPLY
jgi:serine protease Do